MLRLYPAVTFMPRGLATTPTDIPFLPPISCKNGRTEDSLLSLASPDTVFELNVYDMSFHAETWGDDAAVFRTDRFIVHSASASARPGWVSHGSSEVLDEQLVFPPVNRFMPWSAGPRICPGMKFAQVCTRQLNYDIHDITL